MAERSNATASATEVPIALLETFIPGFGVISRVVNASLGFDITQFVPAVLVIFAFASSARYVWNSIWMFSMEWCTSSVSIDDCERLYDEVIEWFKVHVLPTGTARTVKAVDGSADLDNPNSEIEVPKTQYGPLMLFNYAFVQANMPPEYTPAYGTNRFWFKGRLFYIEKHSIEWSDGEKSRDDRLEITCFGRSTQPIKDFLSECKKEAAERQEYKTTIRTPNGTDYWQRTATRTSRPWETVCLDRNIKQEFLEDVCEFLDPATPRYYARRGIPYRRGYLFYGPPGTGKSSLAVALAGIVGLDLCTLSLVDAEMSDAGLAQLLSNLSSRCILLIEDIDAAGIKRPDELEDDEEEEEEGEKAKSNNKKGGKGKNKKGKKMSGITLSGLLNAIDGVSSKEGRVLLMTTNNPESLDKALIRPGRIDMQVPFNYATPQQVVDIFTRMYSKDEEPGDRCHRPSSRFTEVAEEQESMSCPEGKEVPCFTATRTPSKLLPDPSNNVASGPLELPTPPPSPSNYINTSSSDGAQTPSSVNGETNQDISESNRIITTEPTYSRKFTLYDRDSPILKDMASEFATQIPKGKFTPAEVQGYLLRRRKSPRKALEEVRGWRDEMLKAKEKGKNVLATSNRNSAHEGDFKEKE